MVTLIKYGALSGGEKYNVNQMWIDGLSTDSKPTTTVEGMPIPNGSVYTEVDTGKTYMFDKGNVVWYEVSLGGGVKPEGGIILVGETTTPLTDGATTNPIVVDGQSYTAQPNDAVIYGNIEFLYTGAKWIEFGDLSGLSSKDIGAMTGYAKATTGSAITTTDTLNQAIGKVEKRVEVNENNILLKANTSDVNASTANLQAQIDNIVTPVTQDAEVQNARVGADGTSYTTLKERLDVDNSVLTNATDYLSKGFMPIKVIENKKITTTGTVETDSSYAMTDYIPIPESGLRITHSATKRKQNGYYDTNKNWISSLTLHVTSPDIYEVPTNAKYIRISVLKAEISTIKIDTNNTFEIKKNNTGISDINSTISVIKPIINAITIDLLTGSSEGYRKIDGTIASNSDYLYTAPIILPAGNMIEFSGVTRTNTVSVISQVDENGNFEKVLVHGEIGDETGADYIYYNDTGEDIYISISWQKNYSASARIRKSDDVFTRIYGNNDYIKNASISMFTDWAVIGDSYSVGAIHTTEASGDDDETVVNNINLSWEKNLARITGTDVSWYACGGMSAKTWLSDSGYFHDNGIGKFLEDTAKQLYIIKLGINDAYYVREGTVDIGTVSDINTSDYTLSADTFIGNMAHIVGMLLEKSPNSRIIILGMADNTNDPYPRKNLNDAMKIVADTCGVAYIGEYEDAFFRSEFYKNGLQGKHPTAVTLSGMAMAVDRLFGKCVTKNYNYFKGFYWEYD